MFRFHSKEIVYIIEKNHDKEASVSELSTVDAEGHLFIGNRNANKKRERQRASHFGYGCEFGTPMDREPEC